MENPNPKPTDATSTLSESQEVPQLVPSPNRPHNMTIYRDIEKLYRCNKTSARRRLEKLGKKFKDLFSEGATHLVRVPGQLRVPAEQVDADIFPYQIANLESDITIAVGRLQGVDNMLKIYNTEKSKFQGFTFNKSSALNYDDHIYKNYVMCAMKVVLSLDVETIYDGTLLLIDSNIPAGQKLGTSLALVTAIVLALLANTKDISKEKSTVRVPAHVLVEKIISKLELIKEDGSFKVEEARHSLLAYFYNQPDSLYCPVILEDEPALDLHRYKPKEFPSAPCLIFMETVAGASRMKENLTKAKFLLEYRIFLKTIGVDPTSKSKSLLDILSTYHYTVEDLKKFLEDSFDNKTYTKSKVEEVMNIDLIELLFDIPYSSQVIESIFTLNPYQTVSQILTLLTHWLNIKEAVGHQDTTQVKEAVFFEALQGIFSVYETSTLIPSPAVTELIAFLKDTLKLDRLFFTGRPYCKGIGIFVDKAGYEDVWTGIVEQYFGKNKDDLMMFDEIERLVVKSSLTPGAAILNLEQEVWFF
mgnify:CR=1 FL=1